MGGHDLHPRPLCLCHCPLPLAEEEEEDEKPVCCFGFLLIWTPLNKSHLPPSPSPFLDLDGPKKSMMPSLVHFLSPRHISSSLPRIMIIHSDSSVSEKKLNLVPHGISARKINPGRALNISI